jgi:dihydrofolate reductase
MRKLVVFNGVSVDGYFTDPKGDMSWAHHNDPEWNAFVAGNAQGESVMVFGRITYQMMASYWPTPAALQSNRVVAERMNSAQKVVFSRTLDTTTWNNTKLVKSDLPGEIRKMKQQDGEGMIIFGSGTVVSQLAQEGLIDEYQFVVSPIVLGKGRTMFEGVTKRLNLKRTKVRAFENGSIFVCYEPVA